MNRRKYRVLLLLLLLLVLVATFPSAVSATVYMPPTPLPVDRTSISGYRLIASALPARSAIPMLQMHYL